MELNEKLATTLKSNFLLRLHLHLDSIQCDTKEARLIMLSTNFVVALFFNTKSIRLAIHQTATHIKVIKTENNILFVAAFYCF